MSNIDEGLYSRQLLTFGEEAMKKMIGSNILISGMTGLGIEVAKCIILSGAKSVTLHDTENIITMKDLSSSYYLKEQDVGYSKLDKLDKLKTLNPNVIVDTNSTKIKQNFLKKFSVVIFCDQNIYELISFNKFCHNNNIKFILANSHGLFGYIFCDNGQNFTILDHDGEKLKSGILIQIVNNNELISNEPHDFEVGDCIKIKNFSDTEFIVSHIIDRHKFKLQNDPITGNKLLVKTEFEQIKKPKSLNFKDLEESISSPEFIMSDVMDFDKPVIFHAFMKQLWNFYKKNSRFPNPWNNLDATSIFESIKEICQNSNNYEKIIKKLSYTISGKLCPVDSIIGSLAAQEVMKSCSSKYTPINQWLYLDFLDASPEIPEKIDESEFLPINSRYDGQIVVFGKSFVNSLQDKKIFIVGSGAIGCEHIKNFSMMGIGELVVTDMDHIEKSNLCRQFLFRNEDIGNPKSVTSAKRGIEMNPNIKIIAHENKVCEETLNIYNDEFFDSLDVVANALDNVSARLFMDQLCVSYSKPLLESGTLGTKCNVQVVIPDITESYGSSQDPPETTVPVCTLKNFPYLFPHVVQYARDMMEGFFNISPSNYLKAINNFDGLKNIDRTELVQILEDIEMLTKYNIKNYDDCLQLAFNIWHENYRDQIINLTNKFPENHKNEDGTPFWSGTKRYPVHFNFDIYNDIHTGFVTFMGNLWAKVFGITIKEKKIDFKKLIIPKIKYSEEKKEKEDIDTLDILKKIKKLTKNKLKLFPIEFEKDDDTNYHIDFITCAANMRAINYHIDMESRLSVKSIAGKIIPAIATTTSLVSGLVSIELYKVFQKKELEQFRNSYCNIALSIFAFTEPNVMKSFVINDKKYNMWTFDKMNGSDTIKNIINKYENSVLDHKKYGKIDLELSYISYGDKMIYNTFSFGEDDMKEYSDNIRNIINKYNDNPNKTEEIQISLDPILEKYEDHKYYEQISELEIDPIVIKIIMNN